MTNRRLRSLSLILDVAATAFSWLALHTMLIEGHFEKLGWSNYHVVASGGGVVLISLTTVWHVIHYFYFGIREVCNLARTGMAPGLAREIAADMLFEINAAKTAGKPALAATIWCLYQIRIVRAVTLDRLASSVVDLFHRLI